MYHPSDFSTEAIPDTGLRASHFADLVRFAQMVYDPSGGLSGRSLLVNWTAFGIPEVVVIDLIMLGKQYQLRMPDIAPDVIWSKISQATREWFIENRTMLADLEEIFLARDED